VNCWELDTLSVYFYICLFAASWVVIVVFMYEIGVIITSMWEVINGV
jgi:hypothetical protein